MLSSSPTNVVLFDKSYEAHCLGHASVISIITTINLLLVSINDVIKHNKKGGSRPYYPHIKRNRQMLQSLKKEYGSLFQRAYRMDYVAFKRYIAYFRAEFKNTSSMRERSIMETTDLIST